MPRITGRHNAVKEVHAARHTLNDIGRCSHSHQVPGLVFRHIRLHRLNDIIHHFRRLAHCQTADRIAVTINFGNLLHMPNAQILIGCTLVDAKQHLAGIDRVRQRVQAIMFRLTALQPAQCALAGSLGIVVSGRIFHTFVKSHGDVGAKI